MDKYEYKIKTEQMLDLMESKQYKKAAEIADTIDWRRVKSVAMLNSVSEIYEHTSEFKKSREILLVAYDRSPKSKKIMYRLALLALKNGDTEEAAECYEEFVKLAPKDPNQYILKYKILREQDADINEQIATLEELKEAEYVERWAYELAELYSKAGMTSRCIEECDDLILWFSEGTYVYKAMELKMKFKPLTPLQQEKYDARPKAKASYQVDSAAIKRTLTPKKAEPVVEAVKASEVEAPKEEVAEEVTPEATTEGLEEPVAEVEETKEAKEPQENKTVVSGENLEDAITKGVRLASGIKEPELDAKAGQEQDMELKIAGQMKIDEILGEWEAKQKDHAKAIAAQKEIDEARLEKEREASRKRIEEEKAKVQKQLEEDYKKREALKTVKEKPDFSTTRLFNDDDYDEEFDKEQEDDNEDIKIISGNEDLEIVEEPETFPTFNQEDFAEDFGDVIDVDKKGFKALPKEVIEDVEEDFGDEPEVVEVEDATEIEEVVEDADDFEEEPEVVEVEEIEEDNDDFEEEPEVVEVEDATEVEEVAEDDTEEVEAEAKDEEDFDEDDFDDADDFDEEDFDDDFLEEPEMDDFDEEDFDEEDFEEADFDEEDFDDDFDESDLEDELKLTPKTDIKEVEEDFEDDFDDDFINDSFDDEDEDEDDFDEDDFSDDDFEEDDFDDDDDFAEDDLEEEDEEEFDLDKALAAEQEEPSEEEIQKRIKKSKGGVPFDTGFVVTGRYDLNATSEIGLKAGLTEEQKKLFSYFVPVRGMSEQLVEVLDNDRRARREGTSRTGNILVLGRRGSGKTVLAVDIVKAIQKQRNLKQGKIAIVTGESLNKKELGNIITKLRGGAIIIEKAGKLNSRTVKELNALMDKKTGEMLFVLEDQRKPLERILTANPEFRKKFTSKLELPIFINDELVTFGQTYAKENGYKLDEMGILALYSRIDAMQREDHAVTVAEAKEIIDEAIAHSKKANVKHLARRVFGKSTDGADRILLKEEDFRI